jgi:hypothetical protein
MNYRLGQILKKVRESAGEEDVIAELRGYVASLERRLRLEKAKCKEQIIQELEEVVEEAAARVASADGREFLARAPKELGEKAGIDRRIMILPPFQERYTRSRRWSAKDARLFKRHIRGVCRVIVELANERVDDRFTVYDVYRRIPEASFLIEPFLRELEKMDCVEFRYCVFSKHGREVEVKMVHLTKEWRSEEAATSEILKKLAAKGEIPYRVLHLVERSDLVEWQYHGEGR